MYMMFPLRLLQNATAAVAVLIPGLFPTGIIFSGERPLQKNGEKLRSAVPPAKK